MPFGDPPFGDLFKDLPKFPPPFVPPTKLPLQMPADDVLHRATCLVLAGLALPPDATLGDRIVAADYLDRGYDAHGAAEEEA